MIVEEENFPRGGKKVDIERKRSFKTEHNLFDTANAPTKKKRKTETVQERQVSENILDNDKLLTTIKGTLTYDTIQPQMVVLACINKITDCTLKIELPGITYGYIHISSISEPLTKYIKDNLDKITTDESSNILKTIFKVGQYLPVKILNKETTDKGFNIVCSTEPSVINQGKYHNNYHRGDAVWAHVVEKLDHGYRLSTGNKNCEVFLPQQHLEEEERKEFITGEPIWCIITKIEVGLTKSIIRVSRKREHFNIHLNEDARLNDILPGTKVKLFIEKVTKFGIIGTFLNNFKSFVDETHLETPFQNSHAFSEGSTINAYVLFVEPITKLTYLTLRPLSESLESQYVLGTTLRAAVLHISHKGVYLKLNEAKGTQHKGWVSYKRLVKCINDRSDNLDEKIKQKYKIGSKHQCSILHYNHMDRVYICTFETQILKEKLKNYNDFAVGQLVNGIIDKITDRGLILKVGQVRGFVPNLHLTNVEYSFNIKKKFEVGKHVKGRVLKITDDNILFTLKRSLVEDDRCLSSLSDLVENESYPGVVLKATAFYVNIIFYGDVEGKISINDFNFIATEHYKKKPYEYFYIGQVLNVRALKVTKNDKVRLSLKPKSEKQKSDLEVNIGDLVSGVIVQIETDGFLIDVDKGNSQGFLPVEHLSEALSLCKPLFKTYKIGDKISSLLCVKKNNSELVFSKREASAQKRSNFKIRGFESLKKGFLVRCNVESVTPEGVFVTAIIKKYKGQIFVYNRDIIMKSESKPKFVKNQAVVGKILDINHETKHISLCLKFLSVYDKNIELSVRWFKRYLNDEEYLRKTFIANGSPLTAYALGQKVECLVEKLGDQGGCLVSLPNGVKGLVSPRLCPLSLKKGKKIKGSVIAYDFCEEYLEICLLKSIIKEIDEIQDGVIKQKKGDKTYVCKKLLIRNDYALGVLKGDGRGQLVYLPLRLHENDASSIVSAYDKDKFKLTFCGKVGPRLVGFHRNFKKSLDKQFSARKEPQVKKANKTRKTTDKGGVKSNMNKKKAENKKTSTQLVVDSDDDENEELIQENEMGMDQPIISGDDDSELELQDGEESEEENDEKDDKESVEEQIINDGSDVDMEESDERNYDSGSDSNEEDENENNDFDSEEELDADARSDNIENVRVISKENGRNHDEVDSSDDSSDVTTFKDTISDESLTKKVCFSGEMVKHYSKNDGINGAKPILPSAANFFKIESFVVKNNSDSSSDDEEQDDRKVKKTKKSTKEELLEKAKLEEQKLVETEKLLADPNFEPQTAEHFDRLLLASPNSSALWIKYISFLSSLAEIDKARAVAQRALSTINMTLNQEKLNVWIALLHLENLYGTKESFDEVFEKAVNYNDSLQIYLTVIKLLSESGKIEELKEKVKKLKGKFKHNPKMWSELMKMYYLNKDFEEVKNVKAAAIKSIQDKKQQFNLIVKFACLELSLGEYDSGINMFETILQNDPRKVMVWCTYVDQLVKNNYIDQAREVLTNSTSQKLPLKQLKTLFVKFRKFEEQYGTQETLERVKSKAAEYINSIAS